MHVTDSIKSVLRQRETKNVVDNFALKVRKTSLWQYIGLLINSKYWIFFDFS